MSKQPPIRSVQPRDTVEVHLPDGRVLSGLRGSSAGEFLKVIADSIPAPVVAAIVNGELRELTFSIQMDSKLAPVSMADADGARIYRRSLTFLLEVSFADLFPDAKLLIDHSVASGGYYCHASERPPLTAEELTKLETHMRNFVQQDLPFERQTLPLAESIEYFKMRNYPDRTYFFTEGAGDARPFFSMDIGIRPFGKKWYKS